jgi:hypothetical protein
MKALQNIHLTAALIICVCLTGRKIRVCLKLAYIKSFMQGSDFARG